MLQLPHAHRGSKDTRIIKLFRFEDMTLIRDHTLNVRQGATVELLDVEKAYQLNDRSLLPPVLCGLLNTRLGGKIYMGVKRCGLIRGIPLQRKKRDLASCRISFMEDKCSNE